MTKIHTLISLFVFHLLLVSCQFDDPAGPEIVDPEPIPWQTVQLDTLTTGSYMGVAVGASASVSYESLRALSKLQGINYLNIVGRQTSDIRSLGSSIPLYHTIMLDEHKGTDSGVQITIERGVVSKLYLNSGKKLTRWPEKGKVTIGIGDFAEDLYGRLIAIGRDKVYAKKFERISLLTKDLGTAYDPNLADSPEWYFAYLKPDGALEQVSIRLREGKVQALVVTLMSQKRV